MFESVGVNKLAIQLLLVDSLHACSLNLLALVRSKFTYVTPYNNFVHIHLHNANM